MSDSSAMILNERAKAFAGSFFNLGSALAAAFVVKIYTDPVADWSWVFWPFGSVVLISAGWQTLSLMIAED